MLIGKTDCLKEEKNTYRNGDVHYYIYIYIFRFTNFSVSALLFMDSFVFFFFCLFGIFFCKKNSSKKKKQRG